MSYDIPLLHLGQAPQYPGHHHQQQYQYPGHGQQQQSAYPTAYPNEGSPNYPGHQQQRPYQNTMVTLMNDNNNNIVSPRSGPNIELLLGNQLQQQQQQQQQTPINRYPGSPAGFNTTTNSTASSNNAPTSARSASGSKQQQAHFIDSDFPGKGHPNQRFSSMEYLTDTLGMDEADVNRARMEHIDPEPDMCLTNEELRDYGGTAIFVYFRFLKFICIVIAIHFILSLINYIVYASKKNPRFLTRAVSFGNTTTTQYWYTDFFITNYGNDQRGAWFATTIIGLLVIVIGLIVYRQAWIGMFKFEDESMTLAEKEEERHKAKDYTGASDEQIIRYTSEGHICVDAHYRSATAKTARRLVSLFVFAGFIAIQWFASAGITKSGEGSNSIGQSFGIAFIAAFSNIAFTMLARQLTEFEKFENLENADRSLVIKLVCFKIANIMAVYGAKDYGSDLCVYDVIGEQFMSLLIVEIIFTTPQTVLTAAGLTRNHQFVAKVTKSILGDDKHRARFELPVEYLSALYKFCITAMAMVVFPLSTILGFVAFLVEFWAARYRLIKLTGKPVKSDANHRNVAIFITFLIFVAVIATPFAGAAFIMSGRSMLETNTTILCNKFPQVPPS